MPGQWTIGQRTIGQWEGGSRQTCRGDVNNKVIGSTERVKQDGWDKLGISVSGICLVHCLLLPVVISILPIWTSAQQVHGWLHPVFAVLLIPTTILALVIGYKRHRSRRVVALMAVGLLLVVVAAIPAFHNPGIVFETVLTMSGSAFLIAGHLLNWRLSKACKMAPRSSMAASSVIGSMGAVGAAGKSTQTMDVEAEGKNATT